MSILWQERVVKADAFTDHLRYVCQWSSSGGFAMINDLVSSMVVLPGGCAILPSMVMDAESSGRVTARKLLPTLFSQCRSIQCKTIAPCGQ